MGNWRIADTVDDDRDDSALERRPTCRDIPGVFISIPRSGEGTAAAAAREQNGYGRGSADFLGDRAVDAVASGPRPASANGRLVVRYTGRCGPTADRVASGTAETNKKKKKKLPVRRILRNDFHFSVRPPRTSPATRCTSSGGPGKEYHRVPGSGVSAAVPREPVSCVLDFFFFFFISLAFLHFPPRTSPARFNIIYM